MKEEEHIYSSTNPAILRHITKQKRILDIGCGSGYFSKKIMKKGNIVYGIDSSKEAIALATKRVNNAAICNIEQEEIPWKEKFDIIIFADVLEHLQAPEIVIKKCMKHLENDGLIILSLPNIANWTIRIQLLFGNFDRSTTGILDKTHIHFYTLKTAKKLIEDSGLEMVGIDINPNFVMTIVRWLLRIIKKGPKMSEYEMILESPLYRIYLQYIQPIEVFFARFWKALFAYQFIFICKPGKAHSKLTSRKLL